MITDDYLLLERHNVSAGGMQRIYRFPSGYGLSAINSPIAHLYPYAWEFAVLKNVSPEGNGELDYTTILTTDVHVCHTEDEANEFIKRAIEVLA